MPDTPAISTDTDSTGPPRRVIPYLIMGVSLHRERSEGAQDRRCYPNAEPGGPRGR